MQSSLYTNNLLAQAAHVTEKIFTSPTNSTSAITYYDGLGRVVQKRSVNQYGKDIIIHAKYDNNGRNNINYLPYPTQHENGLVTTAESEQSAYYSTKYGSNSNAFSQLIYENTVQNNVTEASMAGESWKIGSGTITQSVVKNALNEIRKYIINGTSATYSGYYTAGTLIKTRIKDPQGNETYEYYNSEERLIATQQHLGSDSRFTYNVYDNLGLVRYVIPSIQAATFTSGTKSLPPYKNIVITQSTTNFNVHTKTIYPRCRLHNKPL